MKEFMNVYNTINLYNIKKISYINELIEVKIIRTVFKSSIEILFYFNKILLFNITYKNFKIKQIIKYNTIFQDNTEEQEQERYQLPSIITYFNSKIEYVIYHGEFDISTNSLYPFNINFKSSINSKISLVLNLIQLVDAESYLIIKIDKLNYELLYHYNYKNPHELCAYSENHKDDETKNIYRDLRYPNDLYPNNLYPNNFYPNNFYPENYTFDIMIKKYIGIDHKYLIKFIDKLIIQRKNNI